MGKWLPVLILRAAAVLSAAVGLLLCALALPTLCSAIAEDFPGYAFLRYPAIIGLYAAAACFFFALFRFWLLLGGVKKEGRLSSKNLRAIRLGATAFSALYYISAMPVIFLYADAEDAPGVVLIGAFLGVLPICAAAVAAILEGITADNPKEKRG